MVKPISTKKPVVSTTVDVTAAAKFVDACAQGDVDGCHFALLKLQQLYPASFDLLRRQDQPLYDLIGHGFVVAAVHSHVGLLEFLISSTVAIVLRDGICGDATTFPPFAAMVNHELRSCVQTVRFITYAALACIDQVALSSLQFLIETKSLWDTEASLCLSLAMRRAIAMTEPQSSSTTSPLAFHPMIVLLVVHYDFLLDELHNFHHRFAVTDGQCDAIERSDRVKAVQASLLYELASRW